MSEPSSAIAQVTIERQALLNYLDATPRLTGAWDDWGDVFNAGEMAGTDGKLAMGSYRYQVRHILGKSMSLGRFCRYIESTRKFTFGTFFYSDDVADFAYFFAVARGLAPYVTPGSDGFAAIAKTLWGDCSFALLELGSHRSRFIGRRDGSFNLRRKDVEREFASLKSVYAVESPVPIDNLDAVR